MVDIITLDYKTCNIKDKQEVFIKIPLSCLEVSLSNWMCKEMKFIDYDVPDFSYGKWLSEVKLTSSQKEVVFTGVLSDYFTVRIADEENTYPPSFTKQGMISREKTLEITIADFKRIEIFAWTEWLHRQPRDACIEITLRKINNKGDCDENQLFL